MWSWPDDAVGSAAVGGGRGGDGGGAAAAVAVAAGDRAAADAGADGANAGAAAVDAAAAAGAADAVAGGAAGGGAAAERRGLPAVSDVKHERWGVTDRVPLKTCPKHSWSRSSHNGHNPLTTDHLMTIRDGSMGDGEEIAVKINSIQFRYFNLYF